MVIVSALVGAPTFRENFFGKATSVEYKNWILLSENIEQVLGRDNNERFVKTHHKCNDRNNTGWSQIIPCVLYNTYGIMSLIYSNIVIFILIMIFVFLVDHTSLNVLRRLFWKAAKQNLTDIIIFHLPCFIMIWRNKTKKT